LQTASDTVAKMVDDKADKNVQKIHFFSVKWSTAASKWNASNVVFNQNKLKHSNC